jgi:Fe-Mn family superoxide dismutase
MPWRRRSRRARSATITGKHHRAYIDKTNKAVEGTDLGTADLEAVIASARGRDPGLFNNAAQAWNHGFYWHSLAPNPGRPAGELLRWIETAYGSLEVLERELAGGRGGIFPMAGCGSPAREGP